MVQYIHFSWIEYTCYLTSATDKNLIWSHCAATPWHIWDVFMDIHWSYISIPPGTVLWFNPLVCPCKIWPGPVTSRHYGYVWKLKMLHSRLKKASRHVWIQCFSFCLLRYLHLIILGRHHRCTDLKKWKPLEGRSYFPFQLLSAFWEI